MSLQNKGAIMGCSNPHPHGQAWSMSEVPSLPAAELASLRKYSLTEQAPSDAPKGPKSRPCLLCEYAHFEVGVAHEEGRVVVKNEHWVALVPWWAVWPFEILSAWSESATVRALNVHLQCSRTSATYPRSSTLRPKNRCLSLRSYRR